jgi:cell division control protein 6
MTTKKNLFSDYTENYRIFENKEALSPHFTPPKLPYREDEIAKVVGLMAPALKKEKPANVFIYGKTGVGKTIVARFVSNELEEMCKQQNVPLFVSYINNKVHDSKYRVLVKLLKDLWEQNREYFDSKGLKVHDSGAPPTILYETLLEFVGDKGAGVVVILDEVDAVKDLDNLLYTLTRANDDTRGTKGGFVTILGISNNLFFKKNIDPRSKSTLCEEELVFPPYNAKQLTKILLERVKLGFKEDKVEESAVHLIAAVAAKEGGDARYALRLLRKAGELAEVSNARTVKEKEVNDAKKSVEEDIVLESLSTLPEQQQIVLLAVASLAERAQRGGSGTTLTGEKVTQFTSGEVYEEYKRTCRQVKEQARSMRWVREYLNDLEMLGFISMQFTGKGTRGQTRLIELGEDATKIREFILKSLKLSPQTQ